MSQSEILINLAQAGTLTEATGAVKSLEVDHEYQWRPVGDRENNYGQINIGADPGHALIERVTNAIDAIVEREAARHDPSDADWPTTPRAAVEEWFGIESGRIRNLEMKRRQKLAEEVSIRLLEGRSKPNFRL
jgi:hypothetical protein